MPKKIKVKVTVVQGGIDREVEREVEVPDDFTEEMAVWPSIRKTNHIGKRTSRSDGAAKVSGKMKYAYDITPKTAPGCLTGKLIISEKPRAKIKSIDTSVAEKIPGVVAIELLPGVIGSTAPHAGTHLGGIAAESENAADDALQAIKIDYEELPYVVTLDQAIRDGAPEAFPGGNASEPNVATGGNIEQGFAQADQIVEATYNVATRVHACLETHGVTVWYKGDSAIVWASTQNVTGVRDEIAGSLGLPANKVECITDAMGGGFGSKFSGRTEGLLAANLSKKTMRPVRMMLSREEEFLEAGNQPGGRAVVKIGGNKEGKITAFQARVYGAAGENGGYLGPIPYIYNFPNRRIETITVKLNAGGHAAFRAPGHPQACFVTDSAVDELAYKLGIDPVEFRLKNDPNQTRQEEFKIGAKEIGWTQKFNKHPSADGGPLKRGVGVAGHTWGGAGNPSTPVIVKIYPDGRVEALSGSQDLGTGNRTLLNVIVAEQLGIDPGDVRSMIGHSSYGPAGGSGGSTTAPSISPSAKTAADFAKAQLAKAVALDFGVDAKQIAMADGMVFVKDNVAKSITFKQAAAKLKEPIVAEGKWYGIPTLSSGGVAGCQFVEVEVDVETGKVQPIRVVAVQDSGLIINMKTWESQVIGGVTIGLGFALLEDRIMDPSTGQMVNANMDDYKLPTSFDIPEITVIPFHQPERGVIGVGEPPTISTAGAVANAVYNACGARVRTLPITPDKVLAALNDARRASSERGLA